MGSADAQTSIDVPAQTIARTTSYTYYSDSRLLKTETTEPGGSDDVKLVAEYKYDPLNGNRVKATATGWNGEASQARSTATGWDPSGRFPLTTTNARQQVEAAREYDVRFGTVTRLTDANGVTTRWVYDDFGRKVSEKRGYPSATATSYTDYTRWDYERCADRAGGCTDVDSYTPVHVVTTTVWSSDDKPLAPAVRVYYDQHNREVRTETEVLVGGAVKLVYKDTSYNERGNVSGTSLPYFAGETAQWTSFSYDDLGRKISEVTPSQITTVTTYTALSSTVRVFAKEGVRSKTTKQDAAGRTAEVIDAKGHSTWFIHDAAGNLTHTVDAYGNTTVSAYDLRGRKVGMVDPDMGPWSYAYNAFGELITQTDAKSQQTQLRYDELGRLVKRTEPDLTTEWAYDSAANGTGKLARTFTDGSYCRTHSYDTLGRPSATTVGYGPSACAAPSPVFTSSTTYDAAGRVDTTVFPTGVTLKHGYNSTLGFLEKVHNHTGGSAGAVYWQWQESDALGRVTKFLAGNNIATLKTYGAQTTWLESIYAGTGGNPAMGDVQWAGYQYDSIGNIAQRSDRFGLPNLVEKTEHDELGRLTAYGRYDSAGASELTGSRVTLSYDALGNIKTKSDTGTYYYNPPGANSVRPHAVAEVRGALNASYAYNDANGNMTGGAGRTFAYTSYNMVKEVGNPRTCQRFIYQGEHQRVQQSIHNTSCASAGEGNRIAQTLYLHPDAANGLSFEQETKGGATRYKHYINAGGMVVGVLTTESASVTSNAAGTMAYFHYDHLGSVVAVSNAAGQVIERRSFDPWGRARQTDGAPGDGELPNGEGSSGASSAATDRGFTLHEHLEDLGLIHMNGRVYDFALGRFTSADPNVPVPEDLQSYNRYAYVTNRPLDSVDPTGFVNSDVACTMCLGSGDWNYGFGGPALYESGPGLGASASGGRYSGDLSNGFTYSSIRGAGLSSERGYNRGIDYSLNLPSAAGALAAPALVAAQPMGAMQEYKHGALESIKIYTELAAQRRDTLGLYGNAIFGAVFETLQPASPAELGMVVAGGPLLGRLGRPVMGYLNTLPVLGDTLPQLGTRLGTFATRLEQNAATGSRLHPQRGAVLFGRGAGKAASNNLVDLTEHRAAHILNRHRSGAGISGKTEFPAGWSDREILHHVSDVATDPRSVMGVGKWNSPYAIGTRGGVEVRVDFYPPNHPAYGGKISTAYPINVPPNP